jgi:hypothetical protein
LGFPKTTFFASWAGADRCGDQLSTLARDCGQASCGTQTAKDSDTKDQTNAVITGHCVRTPMGKPAEIDRQPAEGVFLFGGSFLDAGRQLVKAFHKGKLYLRFEAPVYFLYSHALELTLKAFLRANGIRQTFSPPASSGTNSKSSGRNASR